MAVAQPVVVQPVVPDDDWLQDMDEVYPKLITAPCAGYAAQLVHVLEVRPMAVEKLPAGQAEEHTWVVRPDEEPYVPARHEVHCLVAGMSLNAPAPHSEQLVGATCAPVWALHVAALAKKPP